MWNVSQCLLGNIYCPGNNYHIHSVFNFDLPTHWGRITLTLYLIGANKFNTHTAIAMSKSLLL